MHTYNTYIHTCNTYIHWIFTMQIYNAYWQQMNTICTYVHEVKQRIQPMDHFEIWRELVQEKENSSSWGDYCHFWFLFYTIVLIILYKIYLDNNVWGFLSWYITSKFLNCFNFNFNFNFSFSFILIFIYTLLFCSHQCFCLFSVTFLF